MSVTRNFNRHFRALEAALDIEGQLTGTIAENFEKLFKLSNTKIFADQLSDYSSSRLFFLRNSSTREVVHSIESKDLSYNVAELIFHQLVAAVAHRYTRGDPMVHHWLPVSYTKHFAAPNPPKVAGSRRRRCDIQALNFTHDGKSIESLVDDRHFAHGVDEKGKGFYHLNVEYFFCKIESGAAEAREKILDRSFDDVQSYMYSALAAFFIVQSVRNPHPSSKIFSIRTIGGVIEALIEAMEVIPNIFTSAPSMQGRMAFTPYVPARIRKLADGNLIFTFPLASNQAFTIAAAPITRKKARAIAKDSNAAIIKHARRTRTVIFGVGHKDIARVISQKPQLRAA